VAGAVQRLRGLDLQKPPGVAEAIDWVRTLHLLGADGPGAEGLDADVAAGTLGTVLKYREDLDAAAARGGAWIARGD
jgi:hypothetical protein